MTNDALDAGGLDPFEEPVTPQDPLQDTQPPVNEPEPNAGEDPLIMELLAANGIKDSSKIKFEEEDGTVVERAWKDLSREEQLSILSPETSDVSDYSEEEINLIQRIRDAQQSPEEYLEALKNEAAQAVQQTPIYEIDGISDDELFVQI